ncbi:uncharacterized protein HemX [Bradyrhizobium sp. GM5.1]
MNARLLSVLLLIAVALGGGAYIWKNSRSAIEPHSSSAVRAEAPSPPPASDETKEALASVQQTLKDVQSAQQKAEDEISQLQRRLSAEQSDRKLLSEQVGSLSARLDSLVAANAEKPALPPTAAKKKRGSP